MNKEGGGFEFDNSFARTMEGFYVRAKAAKFPAPKIVLFNGPLARQLGVDAKNLNTPAGAELLCGNVIPQGADPLSQAYAGHQFGGFSPRLGDGRAMLLGEIIDTSGQRQDLQLKGSGRTEFSRGGDGKAALGPVLREYIMGEAMHNLGIATTRALAAVTTGESIEREGAKQGAVLVRVAASHLRVGTFQYFAARGDMEKVRQLADYAIERHYPELKDANNKYFEFLRALIKRQLSLVAKWIEVGFVHGVMNTDNMSISGETIDYGPCAFIDAYNPGAVFSSIDQNGRYGFGNQPVMAQWNLARFAETLLGVIEPGVPEKAVEAASALINQIPEQYTEIWLRGMRAKIGLDTEEESDIDLINSMLAIMENSQVDYTRFFRFLAFSATGDDTALRKLFAQNAAIDNWLDKWRARTKKETLEGAARAEKMNKVNPIYIARNHLVEDCLSAAQNGDFGTTDKLLTALSAPYKARMGFERYEQPAPKDFGPYKTFCGT